MEDRTSPSALPEEGWGDPARSLPSEGWGDPAPPLPSEGWDTMEAMIPTEGWDEEPVPVMRKSVQRPPPKMEDEAAAKEVEAKLAKVLMGKRKIATLQDALGTIEQKRAAAQLAIDSAMPALQSLRTQLSAAIAQQQGTRLPPVLLEKGRELNHRRKLLPAGCTSVKALERTIAETEFSMSHGSLTIKQEKAAIERMRELKKGRGLVKAYEAEQEALESAKEEHAQQVAGLKPVQLNVNIDELKRATDEKAVEMDKLMAARQQLKERREALGAELSELKAHLDILFKEVRALNSESPRAVSRFFVAVQELDAKFKSERERKSAASAAAGAATAASLPAANSVSLPSKQSSVAPDALLPSAEPPVGKGEAQQQPTPPSAPPASPGASEATCPGAVSPTAALVPPVSSSETAERADQEEAQHVKLEAAVASAEPETSAERKPIAAATTAPVTTTEKLSAGQKKRLREKAAKERAMQKKEKATEATEATAAMETPAKDTAEKGSMQYVEKAAVEAAVEAATVAMTTTLMETAAATSEGTATAPGKASPATKASDVERKKKKNARQKERKLQQKMGAAGSGMSGYFVGVTLFAVAVFGVGVAYAMHG